MKVTTDKHRLDEQFAIGDKMFVKLQPYQQLSLAARKNEELSPRYYGPFALSGRIREVAYKLVLPTDSKVYLTFHVSQLGRNHGVINSSPLLPSQLNADLELEELLGVRNNRPIGSREIEVLLKWKDLPLFEATLKKISIIQQQFPRFHLEDKVKAWVGGIDRPPVHITYQKRKTVSRSN